MIAMTEFDKVITTNTANWTPETWKSVNAISQEDAAKRKLEERKEEQEFKLKGTGKDGGDDGDAVIKGYKEGAKVRLNRPVGGSQTKRGGILRNQNMEED